MKGKWISLLVLTFALASCQTKNVLSIKGTKTLYKGQGLDNIECVLYDPLQHALYISNGLDYVPGTDGFISKASPDGDNLELKWVADLNRPTGMALRGTTLYVADLLYLHAIDTESGAIIASYQEPITGSALNDVTIDKNGDVYVSASRLGAVFKLVNGQLELWAQDKLQLKYANGLLAEQDQLLVAGFNLSNVNFSSKQIADLHTHPSIKDLETIISDGQSGYFVTTVGQSSLYHLDAHMDAVSLLVERDYMGDPAFDHDKNVLYIPRGNEDTEEFYISVVELNR